MHKCVYANIIILRIKDDVDPRRTKINVNEDEDDRCVLWYTYTTKRKRQEKDGKRVSGWLVGWYVGVLVVVAWLSKKGGRSIV